MELDNVDVLLGMTIASIILGIGVSMFFINPYTGYGAVVLAIGMMTFAIMITARPRVIERVKREIVLQPTKQAEPTPITPPTFVIPSSEPSTQVSNLDEQTSTAAATEHPQTEEATSPSEEVQVEKTQTTESTQPQPEDKAPEEKREEELITAKPS